VKDTISNPYGVHLKCMFICNEQGNEMNIVMDVTVTCITVSIKKLCSVSIQSVLNSQE